MQTVFLGKHNPRLAVIRKAVQHGKLTPDGLLPIEGPKLVEEALRSGIELVELFVRRGADAVREHSPEVYQDATIFELEPDVFKTIQSTETSQGMVALVRPRKFSLEHLLSGAVKPLIVVLARLQDPGNVGTIIRVGECFNATGCIALPGTVSVHNPKLVRATAGSIFRLPHAWNVELDEIRRRLAAAGIRIVGASPAAERTIGEWDWRQPTAVLMGNEGGGLSEPEMASCDALLSIPQNPRVESLNSAVAAAVILYEASKYERITL